MKYIHSQEILEIPEGGTYQFLTLIDSEKKRVQIVRRIFEVGNFYARQSDDATKDIKLKDKERNGIWKPDTERLAVVSKISDDEFTAQFGSNSKFIS